ncbi:DUF4755 domain-containing protein [Microvirga sp. Mcv34]|uniref:DUF4755 domain-containing protein n=1 Tax=Microvirga sp. Mcv34 TaxID=2926016 RepID=UPI0021C7C923|nr:DUF4755 domain-containing protein [Microvirga sp. Mcv34]
MSAIKIHSLPHPQVKKKINVTRILAGICAVVAVAAIMIGGMVGAGSGNDLVMGTAFFGAVLCVLFAILGQKQAKYIAEDSVLESVERYSDAPISFYVRGDDGKLLAASQNAIFLQRPHNRIQEVPYAKIRNVWWEIPGYSQILFGGIVDGMANNARKYEAYKNSGLFIDVADIREPHWHLLTNDKQLLMQWQEIFNQAFERQKLQQQSSPVARTGT